LKWGAIAMKIIFSILVVSSLMITPCLAGEQADLGNQQAKVNYSVGYQIGDDFRRQGVEINPEALVKGIQDALAGKTPLMSAEDQRATLVNLQRQVEARQKQDEAQKVRE